MSKIKVLHTADIHIGIENYGYINPETGLNSRMEDFLRSFDIIIDYAIDNDYDLVIFAGDAFKVQSPTSTQQREFAKRVYRLSQAGIQTILLAGNHDLSNKYGEATAMDVYGTLKIDNVYVCERPRSERIKTKNGDVQVIAIPYVSKSAFLTNEDYKLKTTEEVEKILIKKIDELINFYVMSTISEDKNIPIILTFHAGVDNAKIGSEKDLLVGKTFSVPLSILAKKEIDYVALGHIHKHQVLCHEPPVVYSGSIERVDFGEENEEKGFITIELEKNNVTYQFNKLPAREFLTINIDVTESETPNEDIINAIKKHDIKNKIIRLRYTILNTNTHVINEKEIKDLLSEAFFFMVRTIIADRGSRMRNPELNETIIDDPIQSLEKYIILNPVIEDIKEDLLKRAKYVMNLA
ncbi:MAG: exonuclease SbcCD subunit D [Candidatus Sericytochromatia bacterium]